MSDRTLITSAIGAFPARLERFADQGGIVETQMVTETSTMAATESALSWGTCPACPPK